MKVSTSLITFRIDIDFPNSDVDMVYKEMTVRNVQTPVPSILCDATKIKIDKKKLPKTPTEASVDFALHWLAGFVDSKMMCTSNGRELDFKNGKAPYYNKITELEKLGVEVKGWYGLMMGTSHLICEVEMEKFNTELVKKAEEIVQKVFNKFIKYYKK